MATPFRFRDRLDRAVGRLVEAGLRAHHRRRLRRAGWEDALDPRLPFDWAGGQPSLREGNQLDVLIDGENALPAIAEALRSAKSHVHIAGWHLTPDFELERGERHTILGELLAELAERIPVRVLIWAGSPAPVFKPTRKQVRKVREELTAGTSIECALDSREHPMHCHHEKLIVIDDRLAFVGGIDLTELAGDRFDHRTHPPRHSVGWHDIAARLRGPIVTDVANHFTLRWGEITGRQLHRPSEAEPAGTHRVQLVRTVPQGIYGSVRNGDYRILESYLGALRSARELIYLENQFLWSPEVVDALREKLAEPPSDDFRLLLLLPVHPNNGSDVTRGQAGELAEADGDRGRFLACSLFARDEAGESAPVYVHAKVAIVDDRWLTLGSANLNERSLFNDTEVNLVAGDPELARSTREQLWAEHLETTLEEVRSSSAAELIDRRWRPTAEEQLYRRERGQPLTHRLIKLPNVSRRSRRLLGPLESFMVDG
jgi:phosphatidylserine/phosphatidylglycerophosphate/cardiolipin synthase-like enzyme